MNKNIKRYCIVILILAIVYNVLIFSIPYPHKSNSVFWLSWAIGLLFIIIQPVIAFFGLKDSYSLKSKIYGWPIIRVGYISLFIQLIITCTFLILGAFIEVPVWILFVLEVLLVSFASIGLIATSMVKETIEKIEENAPITTKFINDLIIDSNMLSQRDTNETIHNKLVLFADEVRYSDPVSIESLTEFEDEILRKYLIMKDNVINEKYDDVELEIDELVSLMKERNQRIKIGKK